LIKRRRLYVENFCYFFDPDKLHKMGLLEEYSGFYDETVISGFAKCAVIDFLMMPHI
jgi:hypothetical protein